MIEKWSEDLTMRFLKRYRTKECLWNVFSSEYRNQQMRNAAYEDLVQEMKLPNFNVERAKNKIKNLRSTYTQELKKMETSKGIYVTSLAWFDEINAFIRPMVGVRSSNVENNPTLKKEVVVTRQPTTTTTTSTFHIWNDSLGTVRMTPAILKPIQAIQPIQPVQPTQTVCLPEPLFVTVQGGVQNEIIEVEPMIHTDDDDGLGDSPRWQIEDIRSERKSFSDDSNNCNDMNDEGDNDIVDNDEDDDDRMLKPPKLRRICDNIPDDPLTNNSTANLIEDEFDAFGRSVALQLKRMSLHCALNTQIKIQTVLTEMRLSEVDNDNSSEVSNSPMSH